MSPSEIRNPQSAILLYGPSGTGKTSMGRILAEQLAMPFYDLDVEIEAHSGRKIPEIFATDGEAVFRELERTELERLLNLEEIVPRKGSIIALGGGALTHPPTRDIAERGGCVLLLAADPAVVLTRLQADVTNPRPLLAGDAAKKLSALLARRAAHYAEFPLKLDTTTLSPDQAAWEAQVRLGIFHVTGMEREGYDVRVQAGCLDLLGPMMVSRGLRGPIAMVCDETIRELYAERAAESMQSAGYVAQIVTIPSGEQHKTPQTVEYLWESFLSAGIERSSTVVALGGGVVGDLTGFAAATWLRGVAWVNVPTTLLAMCDSSLGGKTGADLPQGKNLVGAFHPPRLVLVDPDLLTTLPEAELRNGMAEVIKHGVIADPKLLDLTDLGDPSCLDEIVRRSMAVKIQIIREDPYEKGRRAALNLGHTIGHAIELVSGFRLKHGEAVAIGLVAEARLAEQMGLTDVTANLAMRITHVLQTVGLPTEIPNDLDRDAIQRTMLLDKKRAGGKVKFALPIRIGEVVTGVEVENH